MNAKKNKYLFKSERLGFRNWQESDFEKMIEINSDPSVMEFFPDMPSRKQTLDFISRMQIQFKQSGFCYFAVDELISEQFIGFIGLSEQSFSADFTPCIDIGWRINLSFWNKGYATEGATKCLDFAFNELMLNKIFSIAPEKNKRSIHVMQKIGMKWVKDFKHPNLSNSNELRDCVLYQITKK